MVADRESIARHILPSSATMVGVCLTSISLVKLWENTHGASVIDEYLAMDSVIFLISAALSYFSLRTVRQNKFILLCERIADLAFIIGLSVMVIIAISFAYEGI